MHHNYYEGAQQTNQPEGVTKNGQRFIVLCAVTVESVLCLDECIREGNSGFKMSDSQQTRRIIPADGSIM